MAGITGIEPGMSTPKTDTLLLSYILYFLVTFFTS